MIIHWLLAHAARALVGLLQALPLAAVARLGRACGHLVYGLDLRHRRVAIDNLTRCFAAELDRTQIRALARENFRRIGENFACAIKTAALDPAALSAVVELHGVDRLRGDGTHAEPSNRIVAIGHFGNFEVYANLAWLMPGYQFATTYRALTPPALDRVLQSVRQKSGCLFFERRFDAAKLKSRLRQGGLVLGLLSDQHGGAKGVWGPFLGRECSTTPAPAVFALRHDCPLLPAFCYRVALGRWRIEVGEPIPTRSTTGQPRSIEEITLDLNRAFETAVRQDPANWFWVHRRWKPRGKSGPDPSPKAAPPEPGHDHPAESPAPTSRALPHLPEAIPAPPTPTVQQSGTDRP